MEYIAGIPVRSALLAEFARHYSVVVHTSVPVGPAGKGRHEVVGEDRQTDLDDRRSPTRPAVHPRRGRLGRWPCRLSTAGSPKPISPPSWNTTTNNNKREGLITAQVRTPHSPRHQQLGQMRRRSRPVTRTAPVVGVPAHHRYRPRSTTCCAESGCPHPPGVPRSEAHEVSFPAPGVLVLHSSATARRQRKADRAHQFYK